MKIDVSQSVSSLRPAVEAALQRLGGSTTGQAAVPADRVVSGVSSPRSTTLDGTAAAANSSAPAQNQEARP